MGGVTSLEPIEEPFEEAAASPPVECLVIDVDGFEGPLDLLLKLARDQKVDLTRISILSLVEQYLSFVQAARRLRIEIAADYLVMAAWLAYLKSRLLLPGEAKDDEPSGNELAAALKFRLARLEAMREAGRRLMALPRLGRDVLPRGMPEPLSVSTQVVWTARLYDLLAAYGSLRLRTVVETVRFGTRQVFSLQEARDRLVAMIGETSHWATLDSYLVEYLVQPELRATARASALSATLELVRAGEIELKQAEHYAPIYLRRRVADAVPVAEVVNG